MSVLYGAKPAAQPGTPSTAHHHYDIVELSSQEVSAAGGISLGPILLKPKIKPDDVVNARFRIITRLPARPEPDELTDEQYSEKMDRLIKCIIGEVEIGKRMRKEITQQGNAQQIERMKVLQSNYELERFRLMKQLKMNCKYRAPLPQHPAFSEPDRKRQSPVKASSYSRSEPIELSGTSESAFSSASLYSSSIDTWTNGAQEPSIQRPVMSSFIVPPTDLCHKVKAKLSQKTFQFHGAGEGQR